MRSNMLWFAFIFLIAGCKNASNKSPDIKSVMALQNMSDLATAEYVVTKIIKANDNKTWYKAGDRKILMSCKASIAAGVDLSQITESDIEIRDDQISIVLPRAKLLYVNIKPEDVRTTYEEVSFFRTKFSSEEKNTLAQQAEKQIIESVPDLGILVTAETNATLFIDNFLKNLGFNHINIRFSPRTNPLP